MTSQTTTETLPITTLPISKLTLNPPPLQDLLPIISTALSANYKSSSVTIVPCPNLSKPPFNLAAPGLSGNESIADIGGPPFLHPLPNFAKKYSLPSLISACSNSTDEQIQSQSQAARGRFAIGAGAGPFHIIGQNSELAPNLSISKDEEITNLTGYAKIGEQGEVVSGPVPEGSTDCGLMANLFISDGMEGEVLKITAKGRVGKMKSFTECVRESLRDGFGERCVSMGGVFLLRRGRAVMHVMPDFSPTPLKDEDMMHWLRFFDMEAELVCLTAFHSHDPGLALRMEHTHCFGVGEGKEGKGGHYHGDTEDAKDEVEYEGYFNVARMVYRIDQPGAEQHK